ncbi:hypothetical protein M404DRAFT_729238 [Pisolithus tinctorius Marx 270]|uniref:Uncharacterized protein n=1 Tax=Pisolithus tinctorius Marx 270 TaxID=870435 RepID=A0A0C3P2C9_PISTI|nr:hypothetical protein M404DRAFT_729238 [Pisolithus tinctorius Marx 270]
MSPHQALAFGRCNANWHLNVAHITVPRRFGCLALATQPCLLTIGGHICHWHTEFLVFPLIDTALIVFLINQNGGHRF